MCDTANKFYLTCVYYNHVITISSIANRCPGDMSYHNGMCYYVSATQVTFDIARLACMTRGARLVQFSDQAEYDFLTSMLGESYTNAGFGHWFIGMHIMLHISGDLLFR